MLASDFHLELFSLLHLDDMETTFGLLFTRNQEIEFLAISILIDQELAEGTGCTLILTNSVRTIEAPDRHWALPSI